MSYATHIWEQPAGSSSPTTVEEATRLFHALSKVTGEQNPKFLALAQRLTKRHPCITSPAAERLPESEWAWSDGPLDGKTDKAVYGVGVRLEALEEVRPFVIEQANALGLSVLDEQAGEVYLPDGTVLRVAGAAAGSAKDYDDVPTRRAVEQAVLERLSPVMARHGFKPRKGDRSFRQSFRGGWHRISLYVQDNWPANCEFRLTASSRLHAVGELTAAIIAPETPVSETRHWDTTVLGQGKWIEPGPDFIVGRERACRVTSKSQLDAVMAHLTMSVENRLMPILAKCTTIEGLNRLLNTNPLTQSVFFTLFERAENNIVTAYLAQDPRLDLICAEIAPKVRDERFKAPIARCVEYVQRHRLHEGD